MDMPVRLKLFPPVSYGDAMKNPVYVVQQANQAIYVRLDERRVLAWLRSLDCPDMFALNEGESAGAGALCAATKMDRILGEPSEGRCAARLSLSVHPSSFIRPSDDAPDFEYSGLDSGSLGEYIFPADLAFVVYRNGTDHGPR